MKLIFLGTPSFAVPSLERLHQSHHQILAVITQPDRPRERGLKITESPVKVRASSLGIPVLQPEKASAPDAIEQVRSLRPDAAVVVAYGQILRPAFLAVPPMGCINLHASLLPKYRGAAPIQAALVAGERETGVTTILMNEGMDTGDILLQETVPISDADTAATLHDKLADVGASLLVKTIDRLDPKEVTPQPQDSSKATYTKKITKSDAQIDWKRSPIEIFNQVRAYDPWPGCETMLGEKPLKIWKVAPAKESRESGKPGEILSVEGGDVIVQAGRGAIRILELQMPGGRRMTAAEFLRGHVLKSGAILGSGR